MAHPSAVPKITAVPNALTAVGVALLGLTWFIGIGSIVIHGFTIPGVIGLAWLTAMTYIAVAIRRFMQRTLRELSGGGE